MHLLADVIFLEYVFDIFDRSVFESHHQKCENTLELVSPGCIILSHIT